MKTLDVINQKGEVVAALEIEGGEKVTRVELERHYTHFVKLFMKHLGHNLKVMVRSDQQVQS